MLRIWSIYTNYGWLILCSLIWILKWIPGVDPAEEGDYRETEGAAMEYDEEEEGADVSWSFVYMYN